MLEKTSTNKDGRTQIFFTPFRPKSLDCWEYVSRRFETVNLPHVLRELDLGICFNMIIFDILSLSWKATEISSFSMSLDFFCHAKICSLVFLGHAKNSKLGFFRAC